MKMRFYALCPVSVKKVNERVSRFNGIFTVLLLIFSGLTSSIIPVIFLAIDLFLRASDLSGYSLISISAKGIVTCLGFDEIFINAGPKMFAARLGFIMSISIVITFLLNANLTAYLLAFVLGLLSLLEAAFGICVACEIYPYIYRLFYRVKFQ